MRTIAIILLSGTAALAQWKAWPEGVGQWSREYATGWCAGYRAAEQAVLDNRNHYRRLLGYPTETIEQSMARIHDHWPPKPPADAQDWGPLSDIVSMDVASIDLYVVLPPIDIHLPTAEGPVECKH